MKNFALVIAFALLATLPASATYLSEIFQAAPSPALEQQQVQEPIFLLGGLPPRCYALNGTSCQTAGSTTSCVDGCNNHMTCTCYNTYNSTGLVVIGHHWNCPGEC